MKRRRSSGSIPLAEVIVQMDEKLAEDGAIGVAESEAFVDRVRHLLYGGTIGTSDSSGIPANVAGPSLKS